MANVKTVGEIAEFCGAKSWQVRRAIDALDPPADRVGMIRVVQAERLPAVLSELQRRGWLPEGQEIADA